MLSCSAWWSPPNGLPKISGCAGSKKKAGTSCHRPHTKPTWCSANEAFIPSVDPLAVDVGHSGAEQSPRRRRTAARSVASHQQHLRSEKDRCSLETRRILLQPQRTGGSVRNNAAYGAFEGQGHRRRSRRRSRCADSSIEPSPVIEPAMGG